MATKDFKFLPLTLGIETVGGLSCPLVKRGTPLPAKRKQQFSTANDKQKTVKIEVYLGESPIATHNLRIAKCELTDIPEAPRGEVNIDVTFEVDKKCRINISAMEQKSKRVVSSRTVNLVSKLTPANIKETLKKSEESRQADEELASRIDIQNKADNAIYRAERSLQNRQKSSLHTIIDNQMEETIAGLGLSLQDENIDSIKSKTEKLEQLLSQNPYGDLSNMFSNLFNTNTAKKSSQVPSETKTPRSTSAKQTSKSAGASQSEEVTETKKELFASGQQFDAKLLVKELFSRAKTEIVLIDAYVGEDVLSLLTDKHQNIVVKLLTNKVSPSFLTLARNFNQQYKGLEIRSSKVFHDRFVIIDNNDFYHFGASLEHLGNKIFLFSKIEEKTLIAALQNQWQQAWSQATKIL